MTREVTLVNAGLGNIASVERALIQVGGAVKVTDDPDQVAKARMLVFPGQGAFGAATYAVVDGAMGAALRVVIERGDPFLGICLGMQLLFDGSDENDGHDGLKVMPGRCRRFPDGMEIDAEPGATLNREIEPAAPEADTSVAQTVAATGLGGSVRPRTAPDVGPAAGWGSEPLRPPPPAPSPADAGAAAASSATFEPPSVGAGVSPPTLGSPAPVVGSPEPEKPAPLRRRLKVPHTGWNQVDPTGDHYYFVHSYYVEPELGDDVMWMTTYGGIRFPAAVRRNNVLGCQFHPEKSQRAGLKFLRAFLLGGWG